MKLHEIYVDGFGVWHDLRLRELSSGVTVLYGPNEAGKTTLMHFLRAMLYGVTHERRERYLPPREGGNPGGSLGLLTEDGPLRAERYVERGDDDRGRVTVTLPDGEQQGDRLLREALESVDEKTYCNVFAIGLDEINELGALEGAEAARWIYRLTSGLDRVSLYDVIQGLRASRKHLLDVPGEPSVLSDLIKRREKLGVQIDELTLDARRYSKLAVERDEIDAQTDQLQAELKETERRARRIEIALGLKPLWAERERVIEDRLRFEGLPELGEKPLERLDALNTKAEEHQRQRDRLRGQRRELHKEMEDLGVNEALERSCCRLDALGEQTDWLNALEHQSAELSEDVERLDARVEAETARLAKLWRHKPSPEAAPDLDDEMLAVITPAGEAVRDAQQLVDQSRRELEALRGNERHFDAQLEGALTSSEKLGLPNNIEEAGELVSLLRRRLQAEQKVEQMRRQVERLEAERDRLIEMQVVPIELYLLLTTGFVIAAIVFFWWWIANVSLGGWTAIALFGGGLAWFLRYQWEENRANELHACQQQLNSAVEQVRTALAEQGVLDDELPMKEGAVVVRLQHAEKHLEELERMLPVEAERRKASQKTASAEEFLKSAREELAAAEKEWKSTLRSVGLPDETTAAEIEKLAGQYQSLAELRSRAEMKQDEIERCDREHEKLSRRIMAIAEEADLVVEDAELPDQLEHLLTERRLQQGRIDHRKKLRERSKELKEKEKKHTAHAERIESDRQSLFAMARVDGEQAFRQVVADIEEAAKLDEKRGRLTREIAAAIGTSGTETDYLELMSREGALRLDGTWAELTAEHEAYEKQLRELAVRRVAVEKERGEMVEDNALADKQVEIDLIDAQIEEAKERWRERAAVGSMLELIRSDYEEHRQPETLIEASKYLDRLTRGRYPRVWTPLADDVLLVDNEDGESLPVESLSRGTREQLYLSVRLALVAMYARRGVQLPMILDDVLVNFDDGRARIAADVMNEFALDGHQILLFTCHEHVRSMFTDLGADVRRLPLRFGEEEVFEEVIVEEAIEEPVVEEVVEIVETIVEEAPEPQPAFVDAEYLPLEPIVETRRRVEEVLVEPAPAPAPTQQPMETPAVAANAGPVTYGAAGVDDGSRAYGAAAPLPPVATPRPIVVAESQGETSYGAYATETVNETPAESNGDNGSWLAEAQETWADPKGAVL